MNYTHYLNAASSAFVATALIVTLALFSFLTFEPAVSIGATDTFLVTQQIGNEISFRVAATDVTMSGTINGLTGGYATGTTFVVVQSNNPTGYTMNLAFSSGTAMNASSSNAYISNYTPANGSSTPDLTWQDNSSGGAGEFGYTARASSTGEIDLSFRNNSTSCGAGSNEDDNRCWLNPSTTPETIITTSGLSPNSTTTLKFKVAVPSTPSPALPADYYIATGTLTATNNP